MMVKVIIVLHKKESSERFLGLAVMLTCLCVSLLFFTA